VNALPAGLAAHADGESPGTPGTGGDRAFLLLRRGGATWAVAQPEVRSLRRRGGAFEIAVAGGVLTADEVLEVATELRLLPAGAVLRRFWPEASRGLGVRGLLPLVLIDPSSPPSSLLARQGEGEE
jgi:hypothetical protein